MEHYLWKYMLQQFALVNAKPTCEKKIDGKNTLKIWSIILFLLLKRFVWCKVSDFYISNQLFLFQFRITGKNCEKWVKARSFSSQDFSKPTLNTYQYWYVLLSLVYTVLEVTGLGRGCQEGQLYNFYTWKIKDLLLQDSSILSLSK